MFNISESDKVALKLLGIDADRVKTDGDFLVMLSKANERSRGINLVEKYASEHEGRIGQRFIPPEYFLSSTPKNLEVQNLYATIAHGYRYGGVLLIGDSFVFEQMIGSDLLDELPRDWFDKIPGWTVEFPLEIIQQTGEKLELVYYISRRWIQGKDCLILSIFRNAVDCVQVDAAEIVDVGNGFVKLSGVFDEWTEAPHRLVTAMLFTCSLIPRYPEPTVYPKRKKRKTMPDYHVQPRSKPVVISTINEQERYLNQYGTTTSGLREGGRKAHMRRAHWHTFWKGPRDGVRQKVVRWIPPTLVRGFLTV